MIRVNFKDGSTVAFDLNDPEDIQQWREWVAVPDFQGRITGVGIHHNRKMYSMPMPRNFRDVRLEAEIVYSEKNGKQRQTAERIVCVADNIMYSLLVYTYTEPTPPPIQLRVDVRKLSKREWNKQQLFERG